MKTLRRALVQFESRLNANPQDAEKMIRVGESLASPTAETSELATYTLLCNLILNLDETITRN